MNGAESMVGTLVASGIEVCFANPGTSEMHFVAALDRISGMRAILCLFEGVVTGAADGYGRMAEKPACALLHLGPGLANGLANLHNARRAATPIVNVVGDHATGLKSAGRVSAKTGARIFCDTLAPRVQRGAGRVVVERIPYLAEDIAEFLQGVEQLILVGAKPPVTFFAYPGKTSWPTPEGCKIMILSHAHKDGTAALESLADALNAPPAPVNVAVLTTPAFPKSGKLNARAVIQVVAHFLPEGAILADEAVTSGLPYFNYTATCAPHDYLNLAGGAIGGMMPVGTGAAVACPDRKVVCLEGDGSAMYTLQALWTQARERLDVTTVIYANRSYAILNIELARVGVDNPGLRARSLFDLHDPTLDWVKLAEGMGVEAARAETTERFADLFSSAMKTRGPRLIEAVI
ncbi:MAG TPA: acetolactate synthase large subunit [Chthoniobacterales bacterium]|jgi:acetolactate synthase-1/2/3 large subunit|nr:acetolactate synthase large subunit [Chthoniobacterales bacterium]